MGIKYDKMNYSDLSENLKEFCDGLQKVADKLLKEQAKTYQLEYRQGEPPAHWAHTFPRVRSSVAAFVPRGDKQNRLGGYGYGSMPSSASNTNDKAAPDKKYHCRHCAKVIEKSEGDAWAHTDGSKTFHEPIPFAAELGGES